GGRRDSQSGIAGRGRAGRRAGRRRGGRQRLRQRPELAGTSAGGPHRTLPQRGSDPGERALTQRPFRFGLSASRARPKPDWMAFARHVEDIGFHTLVMPDNFGVWLALDPAIMMAVDATLTITVSS